MLLPRELDIVAAGASLEVTKPYSKGKVSSAGAAGAIRKMPPPLQKTKMVALEVGKQNGKGEANSAKTGAIAIGRQKPSPIPKIPAIEVMKEDGKGKANASKAGTIAARKPNLSSAMSNLLRPRRD
jgi:hypothetical protein